MSTHISQSTDDRRPTETQTYRPTLDYHGERWTASTTDEREHSTPETATARCPSLFDVTNGDRLPNLVDAENQAMPSTTPDSTDP
ncbi:hypothetical protein SAMN04487950_1057 [Halogranum rubrum]|uniref:Uncharacterized protein n=1 Tax=Halogranum rubrum TaxID=553466 RepID=A0A1I4CAR4_9EURY|nr:hypothetical protein [Halogranum rubrum]SFK78035.1 hypothetical protein SAMN04487950_1057 [Halogranum rubrum]